MSAKTFLAGMQLPVNPLEELTFSIAAANKDYEVIALGEVTQIGHRGLMATEINSVFTVERYRFVEVPHPLPPAEYVAAIVAMLEAREPVRLIVTGDGVDINMLCSITGFKHRQPFGELGDYYYTLALKEYRVHSAKVARPQQATARTASAVSAAAPTPASAPVPAPAPVRQERKPAPKVHTVRPGETLWGIARAHFGRGELWPRIYDANRATIANPNVIAVNQLLTLPEVQA